MHFFAFWWPNSFDNLCSTQSQKLEISFLVEKEFLFLHSNFDGVVLISLREITRKKANLFQNSEFTFAPKTMHAFRFFGWQRQLHMHHTSNFFFFMQLRVKFIRFVRDVCMWNIFFLSSELIQNLWMCSEWTKAKIACKNHQLKILHLFVYFDVQKMK